MALSEHEQRMLAQIEQALFDDDPKFAQSVNPARIRRRRPVAAVVSSIAGLLCLIVGAMLATLVNPAIGIGLAVIGFLLMVTGVALFVYGLPGQGGPQQVGATPKVASSLSNRMEERLRRRFDQE